MPSWGNAKYNQEIQGGGGKETCMKAVKWYKLPVIR